jgi:hypothetical protein
MSAQSEDGSPTPYHIAYSQVCLAHLKQVFERATTKGRVEEVANAARDIHARLTWIPLDFGEPTRDYVHMGLQARVAPSAPFVVTFAVDEAAKIVYVFVPFKLLPNSGLETVD